MPLLESNIADVMQKFAALCEGRTSPALALKRARPIAVAWTGGKDSTVLLHLWKSFLEEHGLLERFGLVAVSIDTGLKFPEVVAFRERLTREWGVRCIVARPEISLQNYPVAQDPAACCLELKIKPLQNALSEHGFEALLAGLRRDEHPSRSDRHWIESRDTPPHLQCNPILEWTEMDVWSYIMDKGLAYCELYDAGYRSLGCKPCTASPGLENGEGERGGRNQTKEEQLELLRSLGYF